MNVPAVFLARDFDDDQTVAPYFCLCLGAGSFGRDPNYGQTSHLGARLQGYQSGARCVHAHQRDRLSIEPNLRLRRMLDKHADCRACPWPLATRNHQEVSKHNG